MGQITITLSDERQRALEAEAKRRRMSVEALIQERLQPSSEELAARSRALLEAARENWKRMAPDMAEDEILELAIRETKTVREEKWLERQRSTASDHP